jgi:hypothetical protein
MVINLLSLPQETIDTVTGLKGIHRNAERHGRIATGRHPHQRIVTAQSSQIWLPSDTIHTWSMETRYSPDLILVNSG